ncbi:MAG: pyridoxal phosphate-dependent aminotransferase family protein [Phycisphaerae bacterium]|nr:pyridoxal phosphate-dependent aminotransferase family protein [Phycisphaerae bacterium]
MNEPLTPQRIMESPPGPETVIDGRRYVYFGGTSYLGLHGHPDIIEAACAAIRKYGIHTATSRRGFGNNPVTLEAERLAAAYFGTAGAFYFPSGYFGTTTLIHALGDTFDLILADEHCHFSVMEAAPLPGRPIHRFPHCDPDGLAAALREHVPVSTRPLVLTDGVFSSTGEIAPVDAYLTVLRARPGATILLDDAHGVGTVGENGRGTLDHLGLWSDWVNADASECPANSTRLCFCGTLSKALGGFGGIIPGTTAFIDRLRSASHLFDGASAPPTAAAAASARALEIVMAKPEIRARLLRNVLHLRRGLRDLGIAVADSPAPIVSARCGTGERMRQLHEALKERGFLVPHTRNYAGVGPEGHMRIAVCAGHTQEMIDRLLAALRRLL